MSSLLEKIAALGREFRGRLTIRRDTTPIDSVGRLEDFVAKQSAYVAQTTLYNYVKARMGTRYPRMFEDDLLVNSLNIAKLHVLAACLSDLTIFAVASALHDRPFGNDTRSDLARRCYEGALRELVGDAPEHFSPRDCIDDFARRVDGVDWRSAAGKPENFTHSPKALFRWAPIADELKRLDVEIVENSVKFAWRDVREQFRRRIDGDAIAAELSPGGRA